MPLSDLRIRNAKASDRTVKLSDGGGLQLHLSPAGGKLWRLAYRYEGKQKQLAFGAYPAVGLADARTKRDAARKLLAAGVDPAVQAKIEKLARRTAAANTFGAIAMEYAEKLRRDTKAPRTIAKVEWLLGLAEPTLGKRPIADITAIEVLAVVKAIEARGRLETARRLRSTIGSVFRYAIATARAENDPTFALRGALAAPQVEHRSAVTTEKEFGALLRAVWGYSGQPETAAALKLMALLFPRPGELRMAEWSEFDLDAEQPKWTIPAGRMKMRREHAVPLPTQAVGILRDLQALTGHGRLVFPGIRIVNRPISENTLNAALRRLGYAKDEATSHGFRASASTLLNESGRWSPDAIERALAHQDEDAVRRAYARGAHWRERVEMAQWWADRCDALRLGGDVVEFKRSA